MEVLSLVVVIVWRWPHTLTSSSHHLAQIKSIYTVVGLKPSTWSFLKLAHSENIFSIIKKWEDPSVQHCFYFSVSGWPTWAQSVPRWRQPIGVENISSHTGGAQVDTQPNKEKKTKMRTRTHMQCGDCWNKNNMGHMSLRSVGLEGKQHLSWHFFKYINTWVWHQIWNVAHFRRVLAESILSSKSTTDATK